MYFVPFWKAPLEDFVHCPTPKPCHQGSTFLCPSNAVGRWDCQTFQLIVWPEITSKEQICVFSVRHSVVRPSGADHYWENLKAEELWGKSASRKTRKEEYLHLSPVMSQEERRGYGLLCREHMVRIIMQTNFGGLWRKQLPFQALDCLQRSLGRKPPADE